MITAIHQPNFIPWLGFFHKIRCSDIFVVLDDVQFPKQGGNWINRVRINASGSPRWLTVPVYRPAGLQTIREVRTHESSWAEEHMRILELHYRDAPYFADVRGVIEEIFAERVDSLLEFNMRAIVLLLDVLGKDEKEKLVLSSSLEVTSSGTRRLVDLVRGSGSSSYMCGMGSAGYLDSAEFESASISLVMQEFVEENRPQLRAGEFLRGLSIVDALFMVGINGTNEIIDRACRKEQ